ncbi:hypothetical protein Tco_0908833 [Tanacetum coccineum]|uniref:Uncharacterized protein n=1 Tax=Tanacetum coccineum TaxID=301880 RepID=A0ABQ5CRL3_9ASTR
MDPCVGTWIYNKVIEMYIEHGETKVESYYLPTFNEKLQIRDLNNNDEVVELDKELLVVPHTRKRKFLGMLKCIKTLALEWLTNDQVRQHSGLGGVENDLGGDQNDLGGDQNDDGSDKITISGDDNFGSGYENARSGDENDARGDDNAASGDKND